MRSVAPIRVPDEPSSETTRVPDASAPVPPDEPVGSDVATPRAGDTRPLGARDPEPVDLARLRQAERREGRGGVWASLPNALTFLRAVLVPVILVLLTTESRAAQWWAFAIFVFAAATDSIDGWVARRWHGVTRWGQLADPIADKLLIVGALASVAAVGDLPWWAVGVIVVREVGVTLLRVRLVRRLDLVMPASRWGKAKTISQVVAVAAYLLPGGGELARVTLLDVAVALTVWSGIEYAFRASRLARAVHAAGPAEPAP